jgi:hypothetical protein
MLSLIINQELDDNLLLMMIFPEENCECLREFTVRSGREPDSEKRRPFLADTDAGTTSLK